MLSCLRLALRTGALVLALALPAGAADRIALVVGMADYAHIPKLQNTLNDARGIAETLRGIGFDVILATDETGRQLRQTVDDFAFRSETADLALIYYAGHGVQVQGENFLIPVDADVKSNVDVQRQSVSLTELLKAIEHARKMRVVILDSCRNNPIGDSLDLTELQAQTEDLETGLAEPSPDRGTLVAFSAEQGKVALDGLGDHSPYAQALIDHLPERGLDISLVFRKVRDEVRRATANRQDPNFFGQLSSEPFFIAGPADGAAPAAPDADPTVAWSLLDPEQEPQLLALAEAGDTRSLVGLARMRLNPGTPRFNPAEAATFLERAAAAGAPDAQWELARMYENGVIGTGADKAKALELYEKSAEQDYPQALNDMGYFYYQGDMGLTQDVAKALDFFRRAADQRHPEAQYNFAALIDDGKVEGMGPEDAGRYLYEALRSGNEAVLQVMSEHSDTFSLASRKALQTELKRFGFYQGEIDGSFGRGTQSSLRRAFGLET